MSQRQPFIVKVAAIAQLLAHLFIFVRKTELIKEQPSMQQINAVRT